MPRARRLRVWRRAAVRVKGHHRTGLLTDMVTTTIYTSNRAA